MQTVPVSALAVFGFLYTMSSAAAQTPVGALAVDERQGKRYGWAVDYETAVAAQAAAGGECGAGCSVVLTFARCAAYATDQDADSTAVGWAESYDSVTAAQQAALAECGARGGSGCVVRVWGCNGHVIEDGLNLDRGARRQIQQALQAAGYDPGDADGLFGPRTRTAIRRWQTSRGARATGYLESVSVAALQSARPGPAVAAAAPAVQRPEATAEQEMVFWQSIAESTNPAEFEAYLRRFPAGMFRELAQIRLQALRGAVRSPASGSRTAASNPGAGREAGDATRERPGRALRPVQTCAGQPAGAACWMAISGRSECYVWNHGLELGATVTWTGECVGGFAQGTGTLTWTVSEGIQTDAGRLEGGQWIGHWVIRYANGNVDEGPYVDGQRHGRWVFRFTNGDVAEGRNVQGELHGEWVIRRSDGRVDIWHFEHGERVNR